MTFKQLTLMNGYELTSTFWNDFCIADKFGESAIVDTFRRAFNEWKNDYIYLTELVVVLNHKIWEHYEGSHKEYAYIYNELWEKADLYATSNLKGSELSFFYRITD